MNSRILPSLEVGQTYRAAVLGAVDRGYRVVLVTDAICSSADQTHDALMEPNWLPRVSVPRNFFAPALFQRAHSTWEMNMNSVIYLVGLVVVVLAVLSLIGLR